MKTETTMILSEYGYLSENIYNSINNKKKSLEMYHYLWKSRVVNLLEQKLELENASIYDKHRMYQLTGLHSFNFRTGTNYLAWLEVQTETYVYFYRKFKAEVYLLKLKNQS